MSDENAFQVRIASSGALIEVSANDTLLDALAWHGITVPSSCEQGVCGTCLTGVLEGIPEHRDSYMTEAEHSANDRIAVCCSRSRTPLLVLDL